MTYSPFREAMLNLKNILDDPKRTLRRAEMHYYPLSRAYNSDPSAFSKANQNAWNKLRTRFVRFQNQPIRTRRTAARKIQTAYRTYKLRQQAMNVIKRYWYKPVVGRGYARHLTRRASSAWSQ